MAGAPKGNKNAVKENRLITDEMRKAIAQNRPKIRRAIEKQIEAAEKGDRAALELLTDRTEGKPSQAVALAHSGKVTLELTVIDTKL